MENVHVPDETPLRDSLGTDDPPSRSSRTEETNRRSHRTSCSDRCDKGWVSYHPPSVLNHRLEVAADTLKWTEAPMTGSALGILAVGHEVTVILVVSIVVHLYHPIDAAVELFWP